MTNRETVSWNGKKYHRYPDATNLSDRSYFSRGVKGGTERLHRSIYEHHHGKIPKGYHVHHINGDKGDNRIENLEALTHKEHFGKHLATGDDLKRKQAHMASIRPMTKAWHASPEGHRFHAENGRKSALSYVPVERTCEQCSIKFQSKRKEKNDRFCSNKCRSAHRRASGVDDIDFTCPVCQATIRRNRYAKSKTCGRKCGQSLIG